MKLHYLIIAVLVLALMVGCGAPTSTPPPPEEKKPEEAAPEVIQPPETTQPSEEKPAQTPETTTTPTSAPPPPVSPGGPIVGAKQVVTEAKYEIYHISYLSDGLKVKGYLAQPKTPGIYPAVIWNRGGALEDPTLTPAKLAPYAQNGYVAVGSQYRGNLGSEGREEFGGADVNDVLNLIPVLKSLPNVDAGRIGMVGYSRGGMMTYVALKEQTLRGTNDIKAACTIAGPTDLFMLAEERPKLLNERLVPLIGGTPQEVSAEYEARSAVYWADKINVPLLIQHGEADLSVSVEESRKLAELLDKNGKVYKLITYPGDDHGLSGHQGGLPKIFAWFEKYLQ